MVKNPHRDTRPIAYIDYTKNLWVCPHCNISGDTLTMAISECPRVAVAASADERVSRGFYRHYKGPVYFVLGVGTLDEAGHGDLTAPRQVVYESVQSVKDGLLRLRSESDFIQRVEWPDGTMRPRFERIEDSTA